MIWRWSGVSAPDRSGLELPLVGMFSGRAIMGSHPHAIDFDGPSVGGTFAGAAGSSSLGWTGPNTLLELSQAIRTPSEPRNRERLKVSSTLTRLTISAPISSSSAL